MKVLPNEKETIKRLIQDDKDAFCELYASYKETIVRFSLRMLKSRDMAEDVFQDTFAVIWQSRRFINPEIPFSAYLFTIVKNRVLNILREEENLHAIKLAMLGAAAKEDDDTHETILLNDLVNLLEKAKETLTPKQREVYELSREKNLSHAQIAELLHISKNTVREHITMALKQIRLYLSQHGGYAGFVVLTFFPNL